MAEYIEREALYEKAYWHGEMPDVGNPYAEGVEAVDISDVDAIPAADVAPVVHGRWKFKPVHKFNSKGKLIKYCDIPCCSECGREYGSIKNIPYCNCGAKMDAEA